MYGTYAQIYMFILVVVTGAVQMPGETYQSQISLGHIVPFINCIYSDNFAKWNRSISHDFLNLSDHYSQWKG